MTKLVCPDCRHENEPERIYCHDCGARLERSALKKEREETEETPEMTQRHLQKMFDPRRGRAKALAAKLSRVLFGALLFAVVIQLLLPPDVPEETKATGFAPMINMDLLSALDAHNPPTLTYTQEQVNSYLASALRKSNSPAKEGFLPIPRIDAQFEEGICRLNVFRELFGYRVCESAAFRVSVGSGKITASIVAGQLGRMPIHPWLMQQLDFLFSRAWESLAAERKEVSRLAAIEFHPESVTLVTTR